MRSNDNRTLPQVDGPAQPFGTIYLPKGVRVGRDPGKLKLFKITAPIAVIIGLVGMWFIGLYLWTNLTRADWNSEDYGSAVSSYERQATVTDVFPEPWIAQYNLGTAMLANGDLAGGVEKLQQAFQGVPKAVRGESGNIQPFAYECYVRTNLSAGFELQGDAAVASGNEIAAERLYKTALDWITPCEVPSGSGEDESAGQSDNSDGGKSQGSEGDEQSEQGNEAGDRLREKLNEGQEPQADSESDSEDESQNQGQNEEPSSANPFEGESEEQRQRREELQDKNQQQAEREREKNEQQNRGTGGGW